MEQKERLNVYIPSRMKRRLKAISEDKDTKMNDIVVAAVSDYIQRVDQEHTAPDMVLARINQILNSQMALVTSVNGINQRLDEIKEDIS